MTHKDIYTKFMIEYDKANVTSSYPSLTEYEVATVLDKAYNALIAQKVTGNNFRRAGLETDLKSIMDLSPLVIRDTKKLTKDTDYINQSYTALPTDCLYFIDADIVNQYEIITQHNPITAHGSFTVNSSWTEVLQLLGESDVEYDAEQGGVQYKTYSTFVSDNIWNTVIPILNGSDNTNITITISSPDTQYGITLGRVDSTGHVITEIDGGDNRIIVNIPATKNGILNGYNGSPYKLAFFSDEEEFTSETTPPTIVITYDYPSTEDVQVGRDKTYLNNTINPMYGGYKRTIPTKLVSHAIAKNFLATYNNIPWIKTPVCYLESDSNNSRLYVVYDSYETPNTDDINITYIKKPNTFVKDLSSFTGNGTYTYFTYTNDAYADKYVFECNDTVAEELISLAIIFALENVESQRLNTKLNTRGLES